MFFLNLTAGEFFTLFSALGAFITALYLLDRTRRKKVVSTLRFWTSALSANEQQARKWFREPWSLLLQLLTLLFLLLAVAQLQWGTRQRSGRDHVLLLDTSAWSAQYLRGETLLDKEKVVAQRYLSRLPSHDRVMLLRVDALTTPATPFTSDHKQLVASLLQSAPGFSAVNIAQALSFARQAQSWSGGHKGEIVYIGAGLIQDEEDAARTVPNLRMLNVDADREHCGILHIGVKRSEDDPKTWQAIVVVKNYGSERRATRLFARFATTLLATRVLHLNPGEETSNAFRFRASTPGQFIAQLQPVQNGAKEKLIAGTQAELHLPAAAVPKIAVFTNRPDVLAPLFGANRRLEVTFFKPSEYVANPSADLMLLDQIGPREEPRIASLWIAPPKEHSPLPVKAIVSNAVVKSWNSEAGLSSGLHAKETQIHNAEVFHTFEGDISVASTAEGPIVAVRQANEGHPKTAVIGFDPLDGELKFEVTTPLLFASLMRWLSPEAFRASEITADPIGVGMITLDAAEHLDSIHVTDENGSALPFTIRHENLQFFVSHPAVVHVLSDDRERVVSLTLPDIAGVKWKPAVAASGFPLPAVSPNSVELWKWLALFACIASFIEWALFGQQRRRAVNRKAVINKREAATGAFVKTRERQRELVSK